MLRSCVHFQLYAIPRTCLLTILSAAVILLFVPVQVHAVNYWIQAYSCDASVNTVANGPDPANWNGYFTDCPEPLLWMDLAGASGRGTLRTYAHTGDSNLAEDHLWGSFGGVYVGMQFDDLVITGPGFSVEASVTLHLSALLSTVAAQGLATSAVEVMVQVYTHNFDGNAYIEAGSDPSEPYDGGLLDNTLSPLIGGYGIDTMIQTPPAEIPVNTTFSMHIILRSTGAAHNPHGTAETLSDAGNTLTFPRQLPVFDLPPGYTVNSVEAGISDNQWTPDVRVKDSSWGVLKSRY